MLSILHHYMDTVGYFITLGFALFYIFKGIFYSAVFGLHQVRLFGVYSETVGPEACLGQL